MAFRAVEAAVAGFGVIRREPVTVILWAVFNLVVTLVLVLAIVLGVIAIGGAQAFDPERLQSGAPFPRALIPTFLGIGLVAIVAALLLAAVTVCAVYRSILRPQETGFARIRLGGDELRMALLFLILGLLFFGGFLVVALINFALGAMRLGSLGVLVTLAYWAWFIATFWLCGPMTFATRRLRVFAAWDLTRGRFWPILGAVLLNLLIVVLLYVLFLFIQLAVAGVAGGGFDLQRMTQGGAGDPASAMLAGLISIAISVVLNAMLYPIAMAPPAAAYRDITGPTVDDQAEVFA